MSAGIYRDIYDKIATSNRVQAGQNGPLWRLLKVQEEAGEVAEGLIGFMGANKRKGVTHTEEEVAKELADVVITAMVALHDWVPSPELFMKDRLQELTARIRKEGS
jgi:NTP pyrophosphatase (non-canonical NTP hydrolase)